MDKQIWKFPLDEHDQTISMPRGAEIIALQVNDGLGCIWAIVDTEEHKTERRFITVGTGRTLPKLSPFKYIGTYQVFGGAWFVWHVFETTPKPPTNG